MPRTLEKCCGSEKGQEERTGEERITQLDLKQNRGFGTLFGQETRQKQIMCPSKFERGFQLGISEDRNRQKPLLAKKSVSKRTHPCACTWTAVRKRTVRTSSRMVTYFTFFEHWMPGNTDLRAEPDGDAPDEVNFHSKVKKNPLKKRCGSQPHHGTFLRMLSFRVGRM